MHSEINREEKYMGIVLWCLSSKTQSLIKAGFEACSGKAHFNDPSIFASGAHVSENQAQPLVTLLGQEVNPEALPWFVRVKHVFFIQDPLSVLYERQQNQQQITLHHMGFTQQLDLFEAARAQGQKPLVFHKSDLLHRPHLVLGQLGAALGLPYLQKPGVDFSSLSAFRDLPDTQLAASLAEKHNQLLDVCQDYQDMVSVYQWKLTP